jgi:hypothetical protein
MPTNFPNGLMSFGIPLPTQPNFTTGTYYFVDSNNGSNNYDGKSPAQAVATLAKALALVAASKGDTIYVMPGHTETLTAAAAVAASVAGVKIVGLGTGKNRPVFNYSTAVGASFDVTAANVWLENLYFRALGIDNVTAMLNVQAADCSIVNCEFEHGDATNQAALGILTNASADRLRVMHSQFHGTNNAGTNAAIRIVGGTDIQIRHCTFQGAYASGTGPIENVTTACVNAVICDNVLQNFTASCTKAMVFVAAATGQISRNYLQILSGTAPITGAAMSWVGGNYYAAAIATAGTLI